MKYLEALGIINKTEKSGFMVSFERVEGGFLVGDHFPDKHGGEELIQTEKEAWELARKFADKAKYKCINIYVIDSSFSPVPDYKIQKIVNR